MSTGYNLPCPDHYRLGLNLHLNSLLLDDLLDACKLCISLCCSYNLLWIILFLIRDSVSLISPVRSILNPLCGGLSCEGPEINALARLAC
jgi:hypothetical protein